MHLGGSLDAACVYEAKPVELLPTTPALRVLHFCEVVEIGMPRSIGSADTRWLLI